MTGFGYDSDKIDVVDTSYVATSITVSTTQSQAKVGGSNLANRQMLVIVNNGPRTIYVGPTGVTTATGIPVRRRELVMVSTGENIDVYLITANGTADAVIQEWS